jgi:hypothetical protein
VHNKFYRILDNTEFARRWWLKSASELKGKPVDPESFRDGNPLDVTPPLTISVRYDGKPPTGRLLILICQSLQNVPQPY